MAKNEQKLFPVYCSAPGKKGATPFEATDPKTGKTLKFWVELNKSVMAPEWVYRIWLHSYWNTDRKKSDELLRAEEHQVNGGATALDITLEN